VSVGSDVIASIATLTRTNVIVASHAEGIEAERLLLLARDGDQDRGPFDFVRLSAEPAGIEHNVQVRPGINAMPSAVLLRHRLLHPLWLFRHFQGSSTNSVLRVRVTEPKHTRPRWPR
jgi:hypothetical protein